MSTDDPVWSFPFTKQNRQKRRAIRHDLEAVNRRSPTVSVYDEIRRLHSNFIRLALLKADQNAVDEVMRSGAESLVTALLKCGGVTECAVFGRPAVEAVEPQMEILGHGDLSGSINLARNRCSVREVLADKNFTEQSMYLAGNGNRLELTMLPDVVEEMVGGDKAAGLLAPIMGARANDAEEQGHYPSELLGLLYCRVDATAEIDLQDTIMCTAHSLAQALLVRKELLSVVDVTESESADA